MKQIEFTFSTQTQINNLGSEKPSVPSVPKPNVVIPFKKGYGGSTQKPSVHPQYPSGKKRRKIGVRERFRILRRCGFRCHYCGKSARNVALEIDHVIPIALGGSDAEKNLVAACPACNAGKGDGPSLEAAPPERWGVQAWIEDCCVPGRGGASDLYRHFSQWAEQHRSPPLTQTGFGRQLTQLGYAPRKSGTGGRYRMIAVKT
jgi:HNH endonuclease